MKLTGYNEFILENQIAELLVESQIVYSQKFLNLLNTMGRTPIVPKLLTLQSQDKEIQQNYIDVGGAKDTVTFTPERKVRELTGNRNIVYVRQGTGGCLSHMSRNRFIFGRLGYTPEGGYITDETQSPHYKPQEGEVGKIVATTQGIKAPIQTYVLFECTEGANKGKQCVINRRKLNERDDTFSQIWTTQRNSIKVGRLARALITLLGETVTDAQVEDFVNKYKSAYDVMNDAFSRFDIVEGNKIAYWYNYERYEDENEGVLGSSCMKNASSSWLKIYTKNPEQCKLVILYSDAGSIVDGKFKSEKIRGRAILWKTDQGDMFMERIYTKDDSDVDLYKQFCFHNGWWCRTRQQYGTEFQVENGHQTKTAQYVVTLAECDFNHYPFVDSLCYLNTSTKKISNVRSLVSPDRVIQNTGGGYSPCR